MYAAVSMEKGGKMFGKENMTQDGHGEENAPFSSSCLFQRLSSRLTNV